LKSLIAGGFGIADLSALFFLNLLKRIHAIMGDESNCDALNSYQNRLDTLMQNGWKDRESLEMTAELLIMQQRNSIKPYRIL
jgi:hypothetical protein